MNKSLKTMIFGLLFTVGFSVAASAASSYWTVNTTGTFGGTSGSSTKYTMSSTKYTSGRTDSESAIKNANYSVLRYNSFGDSTQIGNTWDGVSSGGYGQVVKGAKVYIHATYSGAVKINSTGLIDY